MQNKQDALHLVQLHIRQLLRAHFLAGHDEELIKRVLVEAEVHLQASQMWVSRGALRRFDCHCREWTTTKVVVVNLYGRLILS